MQADDEASSILFEIERAGLIDKELLPRLIEDLSGKGPASREGTTSYLVRMGHLSPYQAEQVVAGRTEECLLSGRYRLVDRLGEGGMGVVYRAIDTKLDRIVAVKVLPAERLRDPGAVKRFEREARALAKLSHAAIVQVYDADSDRGRHFLVMECVEGTSLRDIIDTSGPIPPMEAAGVIYQAARALEHAHARGLIHRDLKPSNLLIARGGEVKVLDLGLARFLQDQVGDSRLTIDGMVMGTPDYMAPELFRSARVADERSDIYALGCTLYEMLCGKVPFPGSSMEEKARSHEEAEPLPIAKACPECPSGLVLVTRRMMAKRPADRYASAREVAEALEPYVPAISSSFQGLVMPFSRKRRWSARSIFTALLGRRKVVLLAAAPLIVLMTFILFLEFIGGSPGTLEDFFDPERWATQTAGVFARDEPDAVAVDGDRYPVWRVWARSFSDLESRKGGESLVYSTYSLGAQQGLGKLESVTLDRWDASLWDALRTPTPIQRSAILEGLVMIEGNVVSLRLGELAGSLGRERGADASGVFTFSARMRFERQTRPLLSFFQLIIDPKPPTWDLQQVSLGTRGNLFHGKPYRLDPLKVPGAKPPRFYVPEPYDDLECVVTASDDLDFAPTVKVRLWEGMRVIRERDAKPGEPFRWFENGRRPIALTAGTPLEVEVWAMDSAGMTRGEKEFAPETTKSYAFILDSGPTVTPAEKRVIKGPGAAVLPVSVVAQDPATLRVYWSIDGDTAPPAQVAASSFEAGGIRIPLDGDAAGKLARGGSISLYCLEGDLVYPGLTGPPAEKDWMNLVLSVAQLVKFDAEPEAKIDAASFRIRMDIEDSFVSDKFLRLYDSNVFEWRTNERDRYPTKLTLEPVSRQDLDMDGVAWSVGGREVKRGPVFEPAVPAEGSSVLELGIDVRSNWGTPGRFSARIEYDEKIPLFKSIEVVEGNQPPRAAFDGGVLHVRSPARLGFSATTAASRLDAYSSRLVGTPRSGSTTPLAFRVQRGEGKIFFELENAGKEAVPEGIYELEFTCKDSFENLIEETGTLFVHGARPVISLLTPCNDRSNSLPAVQGECIVRIRVNDPSGLEAVTLEVEKETFAILSEGKMTDEADLEKVLGEHVVDPRTGTILSLEASVSIPDGATRSIVVRALDHPVGTEARSLEPGYNSECKTAVACGEERLPPAVEWLGLDWVLIQSAGRDDGFYITRYEIPVWFWKGKEEAARPPDDDSRSWAPQTGETAESIEKQLRDSPVLRATYFPTLDEWRRVALGPDGKGEFIGSPQAVRGAFRERPEYAQLARIVNSIDCSLAPFEEQRKRLGRAGLVPVNFRPEGLEGSGFFHGLYHFLGNVEEIVKLPNGGYGAAGGRAKATLQVICSRAYIDLDPQESDREGLRGFRLVVYPTPQAARLAGQDRVESKEFGSTFRKRP